MLVGIDLCEEFLLDFAGRWLFCGWAMVAQRAKRALKGLIIARRRLPFGPTDARRTSGRYERGAVGLAALLFNLRLKASQRGVDRSRPFWLRRRATF
jgi:hypothetical protein